MDRAASIVRTLIGLIVSVALVGIGILAIRYALDMGSGVPEHESDGETGADEDDGSLEARSFSEYSWEELAAIADLIEAAPDDDAGRAIAARWGLIDGEGRLTAQTHALELENGLTVDVRLIGILHDTVSDGGKKAGLTFMTSPIEVRGVNGSASSQGGWEGSELRAWLASEGLARFPDGLAGRIVPVAKLTNNTGKSDAVASVTETSDTLWLLSCREVCGQISWLEDEFGYLSDGADDLLNAEGTQYEAFVQAGVDQGSDDASYLIMFYRGAPVAWWYRTPYAFEYLATTDDTFYQVSSSGYASTANLADAQAGVVVGFCL